MAALNIARKNPRYFNSPGIKAIEKDFAVYEAWVKSRLVKDAANKEGIEILANYFSVKPYNLRIVRGLTNPKNY